MAQNSDKSKSKTVKVEKFDEFYNSIKQLNNFSRDEQYMDKFKIPEDKGYSNYAKELIITMNSGNVLFERFTSAFKFYEIMEKLKEKYPKGDLAKRNLLNYFPNGGNKYLVIKAVLRIYHFFNNGVAGEKNIEDMILHCGINFRDFRMVNEAQWKLIIKKFEFENDYNSDLNFWKIKKSKDTHVENNEDSDKTIESD